MKKVKVLLICLMLFKLVSNSFGWGAVGHNIVVEIAKKYCPSKIQDSVDKYLGNMSWENASTWMDEMRSNPEYNYLKNWHYINLEKGMAYDTSNAQGINVVHQLELAIEHLKNKSSLSVEQISFNLRILFHLIGDLHQPLHVGYGVDKGGNDVKLMFDGKKESLHHIWDTDIIKFKKLTLNDILEHFSGASKSDLKKIQTGNVVKWFNDTRAYLVKVYTYQTEVTEDYINQGYTIIEEQLFDAGVRLAGILNSVFTK